MLAGTVEIQHFLTDTSFSAETSRLEADHLIDKGWETIINHVLYLYDALKHESIHNYQDSL